MVFEDAVDGEVGFAVGGGVLGTGDVDEGDGVELVEFLQDVLVDRHDVLVFDLENAV